MAEVKAVTAAVELPDVMTVKELADALGISPVEVIKELMKHGIMASVNAVINFDAAAAVAREIGVEVERRSVQRREVAVAAEARKLGRDVEPGAVIRPPVVTVLGHVDHGKTSLLDRIRRAEVAAGEAGGITQHIGAYQVEHKGQRITFIDTPGHEAFTAMRARGAQVTDIAVLVVAADDGVMPQTIEAINHARAAEVPMIVAVNKIDLPGANPDRVKQQLVQHGVVIEEYGGDTICVPVSAKTGEGIDDLLENLVVLAEVLELKADPKRPAAGVAVESTLDRNRGPLATVLVKTGTLRRGDAVVVDETWGRIKAMFNERGQQVKEAGPSAPVQLSGLQEVPPAGSVLTAVKDERTAKETAESRRRERQAAAAQGHRGVSLDALFGEITAGNVKQLNVVLKTDVHGSIEPIRMSLERLSTDQVKVRVIHSAAGTITESDVMLAEASDAIIIGFNTRPEPAALAMAEQGGVEVRQYRIIYQLTEDVQKALAGMLEPVMKEVVDGHAEVRRIFHISRLGNIAGCYVTDGHVARNLQVRLLRGKEQVWAGRLGSLKRGKDDVRDVQSGYECGIGLDGFDDVQEGDVLEFLHQERQGA